ncbi:uncharacterized protein LOC117110935 [Anneissia japonica]|uniref:uncharacterized protein LOC117110935 n=1 Tax=Anneissia japonica TaxID=1529436 RepID=UPI0014255144|nr:uncharacterized protein LOC117110935 [Anneissia japonica]
MAEHLKHLTLDDEELAKLCTLQAVVKGFIVRRHLAQLRTDYEELTLRLEQQHSNQSTVDWHSEYPCIPHHYIKKKYKKRPVVENKLSPETKHKQEVDGCENVEKQVKQNEKASEKTCMGEESLETCMLPERIRSDITRDEQGNSAINGVQIPETCLQTEINSDGLIRALNEDEALASERSNTASLESVNRTDVVPIEGDLPNQKAQLTRSFQMDGDIQAPEKENKKEIEMDQLIQNGSSTGCSKKTEDASATQSDEQERSNLMQEMKDGTDQNAKLGESCTKMDGPSSIDSNVINTLPEDKVDMQASRFGIHNETSVWGSELSFRGTKNYPTDPEELKELRNHVAMELLWVQQAIISRKNYLRLKGRIDCKS